MKKKYTNEQMKTLYRQAFGGMNEAVLDDIACRFWAKCEMHSAHENLEELLFREGQRSVYLHIMRMIAE